MQVEKDLEARSEDSGSIDVADIVISLLCIELPYPPTSCLG